MGIIFFSHYKTDLHFDDVLPEKHRHFHRHCFANTPLLRNLLNTTIGNAADGTDAKDYLWNICCYSEQCRWQQRSSKKHLKGLLRRRNT